MKIYMGGSPCTKWSIAQTKDRETEPTGIGWELFKNFTIGLKKYKPDYFLYENNKSMAPAIKAQITEELEVEPILINSAMLSAQNRQRYYWTNIPGAEQPEDMGILLADVLESGTDLSQNEKGYCLTAIYGGAVAWNTLERSQKTMVAEPIRITPDGKSQTLKAQYGKNSASNAFRSGTFGATMVAEPIRIGTIEHSAKNPDFDSQQYRVYSPHGKSVTLCGNGGGIGAKTGLYAIPASITHHDGKTYPVYQVQDGLITIKDNQYPIKLPDGFYIIRKLTVLECMRLQTVPEWYTFPVSNTQAYKMLGNGWTVEVIKHILSYIPDVTTDPIEAFGMYDGMSCGQIALQEMGANVTRYYATEIDKYAIQTTQANFPDTIQLGDAFQVRDVGWRL